jgi:alpha-L-rhamnosidase
LEQHYASLKKLTDSLSAAAKEHLIPHEDVGDHMEPQAEGFSRLTSRHTPTALTANAYYYCHVSLLARMAEALGRVQDARKYGELAENIKNAFNLAFYDSTAHQYATGSQTSDALPLSLGLVPRDQIPVVMRNLVDDIVNKHATHVSTGIIGSNAVVQVLPQYGAAELMYKLATQTTYPSLGYQVAMGATTVCETYECSPWTSQNMKMFGSLDKFFYRNLVGIEPKSPGYRRVLIKPLPLGDLHSVTASERTVRGDIAVEWNRGINAFELKVSIPAGMEADIAVPKLGLRDLEITEGTTTVWHSNTYFPGVLGLTSAKTDGDAIVFHTGSGAYHFVLNGAAD